MRSLWSLPLLVSSRDLMNIALRKIGGVMELKKYFCESCCLEGKGYAMGLAEIKQHLDSHPGHKQADIEEEINTNEN